MKKILTVLIIFTFLFSVNAQSKKYVMPSNDINKWYSTGVFYEMYVRSFYDSNGDKYGDFKGVIEKIDYLKKLGISGLWLMPINDSEERTNNYDPVDYMATDPTYGTMDEFKELISACHNNGIRVILDIVANHTSSKHPFFIDASTNVDSKYRNWYVWSDKKDKKFHESPTGFYYAHFVNTKPDLNLENPEVIEYLKSVMRFWLDVGVDGFRFDAVTNFTDSEEKNQEIFREFRKVLYEDAYKEKDLFVIAEASSIPYSKYLGNGKDMFNAVFDFKAASGFMRMVKSGAPFTKSGVNLVEDIVRKYAEDKNFAVVNGSFYGVLLTNHDLFTGQFRPFREFEGNMEKTKLAGSLYITFPGIPFVYYGEEIALDTPTSFKGDRFLRCCMQWDDSANAGFTTNAKSWNVINQNYPEYNVKKMEGDENSILNHYRKLINIRKENTALSLGSFQSLPTIGKNETIIAYYREFENNKIVVIHNFSDKNGKIKLDLTGTGLETGSPEFETLLGDIKLSVKKNVLSSISINPNSSVILKVK